MRTLIVYPEYRLKPFYKKSATGGSKWFVIQQEIFIFWFNTELEYSFDELEEAKKMLEHLNSKP